MKLNNFLCGLSFFLMGYTTYGLTDSLFKPPEKPRNYTMESSEVVDDRNKRIFALEANAIDSAIIPLINSRLTSLENSALDHAKHGTDIKWLLDWADKTANILNNNMKVYANRDKQIYETIRANDGIIGRHADKAKEIAEKALAKAEKIEFDLLPWESVPQKTSEPDSSPEKDDERTEN